MAAAPDPRSDSDPAPERFDAMAEASATALRPQLDALVGSIDSADQALVRRFQRGCALAMEAAKLCEAFTPESPQRARVEGLRESAGAHLARCIADVERRAAKQAEETPRQKERRRRFADARKRERGMSPDQRERGIHDIERRLSYKIARKHGASHLEARRFSLGLPPMRQGSAVQAGRERRAGCNTRRRGSRRSSSGGGDSGSDGEPAPAGLALGPRRKEQAESTGVSGSICFGALPTRGAKDASWALRGGETEI